MMSMFFFTPFCVSHFSRLSASRSSGATMVADPTHVSKAKQYNTTKHKQQDTSKQSRSAVLHTLEGELGLEAERVLGPMLSARLYDYTWGRRVAKLLAGLVFRPVVPKLALDTRGPVSDLVCMHACTGRTMPSTRSSNANMLMGSRGLLLTSRKLYS